MTGYGEKLLTQSQNTLPEADLMARFAATGIPSAPYKMTRDLASDGAASLGSADPNQVAPSAQAIIADSDWVAIQSICSG